MAEPSPQWRGLRDLFRSGSRDGLQATSEERAGPDDGGVRFHPADPARAALRHRPVRSHLQQLRHPHGCGAYRFAQGRRLTELLESGKRLPVRWLRRRHGFEEPRHGFHPDLLLLLAGRYRRDSHGFISLRHQPSWLGCRERAAQHDHEGASRMIDARKNERGQAIVLMVLALVVLLGMAALVLDVGNWFHTKRRLQATSDAAALAAAQKLPEDPSGAAAMAMSYANQNGGDVAGADIVITSTAAANDTISVKARRTDPGIFSSVLGIGSANIDAHAKARVGPPAQARYVAPMVVYCGHQLIHNCQGNSNPDFGPGHK